MWKWRGRGYRTLLATEMHGIEEPEPLLARAQEHQEGDHGKLAAFYCPLHVEIVKFYQFYNLWYVACKVRLIHYDYDALYIWPDSYLCMHVLLSLHLYAHMCWCYIEPIWVLVPSGMMHRNHWIELKWIELYIVEETSAGIYQLMLAQCFNLYIIDLRLEEHDS